MSITHPRPQPSLMAVRAFEAAGRLGSFTLAAGELGLTQSAISRHVCSLEERLGVGLFERHGRHIALTGPGATYLAEVSAGLSRIHHANLRMMQHSRPKNRVTISMLPSVAALWLAPRLHEFTDAYPGIDIRIHASRSLIDFDRDDVDLAIRYGAGRWPGCKSQLLAEERLIPVCAPEFARRHRLHVSVRNLLAVPLLLDDIPNSWDDWLKSAGQDPSGARYGAAFDEGASLLSAATEGAGVALGRGLLIRSHLEQGRLVTPINHSIPASYSYWLVEPAKPLANPAIRTLAKWLRRAVPSSSVPGRESKFDCAAPR